MASPILRSFLFGPDYANYMMDREKLAEIEANLKPFEQRQSELSSLVGQSRAPFEPLAIRQEQPQEVMAQPSVERRLSPYGSPAISGMGEQPNARTMAQPETLDLLPVENVTQGNVEQELEKIRQTRALLDQRRAADERIKGMGTFEQQLSSSPLSKMITDPDAQNLMPGLEKRLSLMKQAEQDTVAPAREGIGQLTDQYREYVPARADMANLLANTGRTDDAFKEASAFAAEVPTPWEIEGRQSAQDLAKDKLALSQKKASENSAAEGRRNIALMYQMSNNYKKDMAQIFPVMSALRDVDEVLVGVGVEDGIYGTSNESLNRFAGKFTRPLRGVLYGTSTDPNEEALRSVVSKYFNVNLREASGQAVTENEMVRLQAQYGLDVFGSASALLDAIRRDARLKQEQAKGYSAALAPEFRDEILGRQGIFSVPEPLARPKASPVKADDAGLDAQKRARLEELRKKKAAGTLR